MDSPFFSIIIPTRDRHQTIIHSIDTILNQSFTDFEIIISDNSTNNETLEIVKNIDDKRINYLKTDGNLSMVDNWEYSLSKSKGKYILYVGDDDGLLSQALEKSHRILNNNNSEVLFFDWIAYNWPDQFNNTIVPNKISLTLINEIDEAKEYQINVDDIIFGREYYYIMPTIYTAFVSNEIIQKIIAQNGKFFNSICPDIYSGFLLCSIAKKTVKLNSFLGIRGTSKFSNGAAFSLPNENNRHISSDFNDLNEKSKIEWNENIPFISNNYAYVLEAYTQYCEEFKMPLSQRESFTIFIKLIRRVYHDLSQSSQKIKKDLETISNTIKSNKLLNKLSKTILLKYASKLIASNEKRTSKHFDVNLQIKYGIHNNQLTINGANFNLKNILELQLFLEKLLK